MAVLRLANDVAASWGVEVEWAWPRDWGRVGFGQWRGGFLGCGRGVGVATKKWAWPMTRGHVEVGQWRGGFLGCGGGGDVATGLGPS